MRIKTTTQTPSDNRSPLLSNSVYHQQPVASTGYALLLPRAHTSRTYPRRQCFHATQTPSENRGRPLSSSAYYKRPVVTPSYRPPSPGSFYINYADPQYSTPRQIISPPQITASLQWQYSSYQYPTPQQYSSQYTMFAQPQYLRPSTQEQTDYFAPKATPRPISSRFSSVDIPRSQSVFEPAE